MLADAGRPRGHPDAADRRPGPARRPPRRAADPRQLPHRQPDRRDAGADALGAAPGGLPARPRRRDLPPARAGRRRRRARPHARHRRARRALRGPAAAARRRSARRPRRSWSPTPAPTSTAARSGRPPYPSASCSTPSTAPRPSRCATGCVVEHPLQPFDARNVTPGSLGVPTPFTFDPALLVAARTAVGDRPPAPDFLPAPAGAGAPLDDIALADLVAFFKDPVKGFFRSLDLTLPWDVDGVSDAMPVEIDALETWGVGDRMLADMLRVDPPRPGARRRVAPRRPAARPARLAQGRRDPRRGHAAGDRGAHPPPGRADAPTTSTSTSTTAAGSPARSAPSTPTGWSPSATPVSTASSCSSRGSGCSRWPPTSPTTTGPR